MAAESPTPGSEAFNPIDRLDHEGLFQTLSQRLHCAVLSLNHGTQTPMCWIFPRNSSHVSAALILLNQLNVPFQVATGNGVSDEPVIAGRTGACISLESVNEITTYPTIGAVWLGIGALYGDVYQALERHDWTVPGSRSARKSVGSHVLGGGFSWFANELGWTCDQLEEVEIVTPGGRTLVASRRSHRELFRAIKGSRGSFGIVTKVKLGLKQASRIHFDTFSFDIEAAVSVFKGLQEVTDNARVPNAQGYVTTTWTQGLNKWVVTAYLSDTRGIVDFPDLEAFTTIPPAMTASRDTTASVAARASDNLSPLGLRHCQCTITCKMSADIMPTLFDIARDWVRNTELDTKSVLKIIYQPLTASQMRHGIGTNAFELDAADAPLLVVGAELWWSDEREDNYFEESLVELLTSWTFQLGTIVARHEFVYPNFAGRYQNPFEDMSEEARARLESVKARYDPDKVWERLVVGRWRV